MLNRLKLFMTIFDKRFEDLNRATWKSTVYRDFSAGLIVAMTAIPMAMGFAMAMGMRPSRDHRRRSGVPHRPHVRRLEYQVYGPTAAFIPVIAGLMARSTTTASSSCVPSSPASS